jgi:hypothetical protein
MSILDRLAIVIFYTWEGSAIFGLLVFAVAMLALRGGQRVRSVLARRVGLTGGLAVLGARTLIEVHFFLGVHPWFVAWWQFTAATTAAAVTIAVVAFMLWRRRVTPLVPVTPVVRRGWRSFTGRRDEVQLGVLLLIIVGVSVAAGLASSRREGEESSVIEIPGGGYGSFFGWAYSVPMLIAVAALSAALVVALHNNAARPYLRPGTVDEENVDRRALASTLSRLAAAALLLPLGGALRFIGSSGMSGNPVEVPGYGRVMLTTGYQAFAPFIDRAGGLLEIWAVVLLLVVISGRSLSRRASR